MGNQIKEGEIAAPVRRKILAAILSSLLFALISMIDGFDWNAFFIVYYLNLMFVLTYGVITSLFSDWISRKISKRGYIREITSFLFHCLFGTIFFVISLISAIFFFIIDRLLVKVKIGWLSVIIALFIVVLVFIIMINS